LLGLDFTILLTLFAFNDKCTSHVVSNKYIVFSQSKGLMQYTTIITIIIKLAKEQSHSLSGLCEKINYAK